jgi:hypothetical protein
LFSIEFLLGKTFSNAVRLVRLLRESVIMILLQIFSFGYSIAFKIANISTLKIVVCGNNRYLNVEEGITAAQPACSSFNDPSVYQCQSLSVIVVSALRYLLFAGQYSVKRRHPVLVRDTVSLGRTA